MCRARGPAEIVHDFRSQCEERLSLKINAKGASQPASRLNATRVERMNVGRVCMKIREEIGAGRRKKKHKPGALNGNDDET